MNEKTKLLDSLQNEILMSDLSEEEKTLKLSLLQKADGQHINLLLVGATSSGKSSTVNALFDMSVARVGVGVDPETKEIIKYDLGNLTIWDTPGLGDTVKNDREYIKQIVRKLSETDPSGSPLIDLVMVVLDASSKDLAVSYSLINETLIPHLGISQAHRILIGLNQSDMAMKGRHWDNKHNAPDGILQVFLTEKVESIKKRIFEATSVIVEPVCYSAGYTEDNGEQQSPYNLTKLLYRILMSVPAEKRILLADKLNRNESNWLSNDNDMDYSSEVKKTFFGSLLSDIGFGAENGAIIGGLIIGTPGVIAGGLVGGVVGGLHALILRPLSKFERLSGLSFFSKLKPVTEILDSMGG